MKILEDYFHYYDLAKDDEKSRERLISLFSEKIEFVLNGDRKQGMNSWKSFLNMFFEGSLEIKHMYEGWKVRWFIWKIYRTQRMPLISTKYLIPLNHNPSAA
ncbi:hypothetical protein [Paenibacillus sp. F4]|uniref:hypothetical protein n=1 Tax=Paenibacillus sp. F4 TaxID=357385 RepID=UPI002155C9A4|nr:hypothetical protein [Paenibacillus sp. F4]